jgi:hypothetical protein
MRKVQSRAFTGPRSRSAHRAVEAAARRAEPDRVPPAMTAAEVRDAYVAAARKDPAP